MFTSLVAQIVKDLPVIQDTQVQSLGQEDRLEKGVASEYSSIPRTEESFGLQSMELQRVEHD